MALDPNVQVALVSIIATSITTLGVILVAVINNRRERARSAHAGVEVGLNDKDILQRLLALIAENERKEQTIVSLNEKIRKLTAENRSLRAQLRNEVPP